MFSSDTNDCLSYEVRGLTPKSSWMVSSPTVMNAGRPSNPDIPIDQKASAADDTE
jgi:hypothetical protein